MNVCAWNKGVGRVFPPPHPTLTHNQLHTTWQKCLLVTAITGILRPGIITDNWCFRGYKQPYLLSQWQTYSHVFFSTHTEPPWIISEPLRPAGKEDKARDCFSETSELVANSPHDPLSGLVKIPGGKTTPIDPVSVPLKLVTLLCFSRWVEIRAAFWVFSSYWVEGRSLCLFQGLKFIALFIPLGASLAGWSKGNLHYTSQNCHNWWE